MALRVLASFGLGIFIVCTVALPGAQARNTDRRAANPVEEIYVGRSWRESRQPPTDFCAGARPLG